MKVTIGMTAHNCLTASKFTLESLFKYTTYPFDFVIADNASTDGSVEYFKEFISKHHNTTLSLLDKNYGCARAFNEIIKLSADSDLVVLINNDITVSNNWLENLTQFVTANPMVGMCSPFPVDNHINEETKQKWFGYNKDSYDRNGTVHPEWFNYAFNITSTEHYIVDLGIHGCAMALTKECINTVGKFDEQFVQGCYEDNDYVVRSERAGFLILTTHASVIYHIGGTTQHHVTVNEGGNGYQHKNKLLFEKKWGVNLDGLVCSRGMFWDNSVPDVNVRKVI